MKFHFFTEELLIESISDYMIVKGCGNTESGNYCFTFKEIARHFNISLKTVKKLEDKIIDKLYENPQICDEDGVWTDEYEFSLMFFGNFCNVDMED